MLRILTFIIIVVVVNSSINTLMGEERIRIFIIFYKRDYAMLLDYKSHTFIYEIAINRKITINCYFIGVIVV